MDWFWFIRLAYPIQEPILYRRYPEYRKERRYVKDNAG